MNAFTNVRVQPVYGQFRALLTWQTRAELAGGYFTVFKSPDGVNDWQVVAEGQGIDSAVDTNLVHQGKLLEHYYKIKVVTPQLTAESNKLGTFGTVRRDEFGAARLIMQQEFENMRRFTRLLLCKLRVHAPPCPVCVTEDTDQAIGVSLCTSCWTTKKDGGYYPPIETFGKFLTTSPVVQRDSSDGTGTSDPSSSLVRLIAFPLLRKNDMLIEPESDRRYLVEDVDYARFGGKIPFIASVRVDLMPARDIRYQFPAL